MVKYNIGDTVIIDNTPWRIERGAPGRSSGRYVLAALKQCETIGCVNPALDRMTQIAPATNIRVCGECAAKFKE